MFVGSLIIDLQPFQLNAHPVIFVVIFKDFIPRNCPGTFTHWAGCLRLWNISDYDDLYFQELC